MRAYLALFNARFQELLQYRAAAIAGLATQIFWGMVRVMIFAAFYRSTSKPAPMRVEQVVTYVWLGQCFFRMLPAGPDKDVSQKIKDGGVAFELVRPLDLYWLWYSRALASLCGPVLLRAPPMFLLAWLFLGLRGPASVWHGLVWAGALSLGFFVSAGITSLLTLALFWTISGEGLTRLVPALAWLASGSVLPLVFFPDGVRRVLELLPFSACLDAPARIYTGQYALSAAPGLLLQQALWAVSLIVLGRAVLRRGLARVVVQGG